MEFDFDSIYGHGFSFTFDDRHGFGILYRSGDPENPFMIYYEDGALLPSREDFSETHMSIVYMQRFTDSAHRSISASERSFREGCLRNGTCDFSLDGNKRLSARIKYRNQTFSIQQKKERYYLGTRFVCTCGKNGCFHARTAGIFVGRRMRALLHDYTVTAEPVDKSLFLDPDLTEAVDGLEERDLDAGLIRGLQGVCRMLKEAGSQVYYQLFHAFLLDMAPSYGEYYARFLEERRGYLLTALFDDPGYRTNVLDQEDPEDAFDYEGRQHRSNRTCVRRLLKEYKRVVREMDVQGDYRENPVKELLLKTRDDAGGLLHYYAAGKEDLDKYDLPFLERIARCCVPDDNMDDLQAAAGKLDELCPDQEAEGVLRLLAGLLPSDRRVDLYAGLLNVTMTMEELKKLPLKDQRKLINSTPLSEENLRYVMDTLLEDASAGEKGRFLLRTIHRLGVSWDKPLKKYVAEAASHLPDSRLLLAYIRQRLGLKGEQKMPEGRPDRELTEYFSCAYEIIREESGFYTEFMVIDPESDRLVLISREEEGTTPRITVCPGGLDYPPSLVREVCLRGREEAYRREEEKNREAVSACLFEKRNRKFAGEYRRFCASLSEEKLLVTESGKAGIEWQVFREEGSNALALRVGRNRMYVIKDAVEFLHAFRTGTTVEYGKDLILTHDLGNLAESDAAAVKYLMAARIKKGRKSEKSGKRYITVSDSLLGNLFELLAGRTILYNSVPCLVRMDPVKIRIRVSGRFELSTSLNEKRQEFLNLAGRGYLLTRQEDGKDPVIDQVEASPDEIGLIDLVLRNPSICVKPILPDFRRNIYTRFFDMIDVDRAAQRELGRGQIRLNTYFDFEKSVITARTTAVRDGMEVSPDQLTDRIDRMKCELLEAYLETLGFEDGRMTDEARILTFFRLDFTRLKSLTNVYLSESLKNMELRTVGRPVIRVAYNNNMISVFLEKSDYDEADMEQILAGLRKKKKFILLSGDRIVDLDTETAKDLGAAVKDFGLDPRHLSRKKKVSMAEAIKAFSHEKCCRADRYLRDMIEEIRSFKEADIPLPDLAADLRDYQAEGFRWLSILARYGMGGILADDMGLGKTIQIIALLKSDGAGKPSLVVCPKSLVFNWISEFARFDPDTEVVAVYGPESRRSETIKAIDYGKKAVYITSYDSLRNDIDKYTGEFSYGILDEAQYIKNVHALKTKSVKELKASRRFALTGTPIENSIVDLWSIFDFIMPGYFDDLAAFRDSDTDVIARKAAPFILRRVKQDVLEDLPPRYERILSAELTDGQRRLYEAMRLKARQQLEEGGKAFDLLPYLTRLRQICVDPGMFADGYREGSGKLAMLSELVPEYLQEGHRILIFSQFVKALESVRRLLEDLEIPVYCLTGDTPARERIEMMDSFNNGSGIDVFLISLKAGGTGLNLIGADTVIHLDPWWNVAAENQASDRTHRIGQTRNVEVIRLIAADTIEQKVVELQEIKKEVIRQVISDDDGSVTSARLEDIAFVLE